ncbi:phage baseplate assembly protein V [Phormidium tenue]|uniref:Gp5/Type VI secretion system Vgr protein OB-fold domain-containing protein n=2 Tax=Phormidium tenue TaxID=126344 RepID=A0A1U7IXU5_9CYAN|nr:phage baseplate assembly protein V [Phormidium tenue]MBD2233299.1 phage baseplate assembly protein V [Phormidium tenue FACHB-1052]OKH43269.1 hypothetical protein NIES30_25295 [Phormidium tenue NIES-30]
MIGMNWLVPSETSPRFYGVAIGVVTSNKDPDHLARVKVKFPWLSGTDESHWARVLTPMAGKERGFYCLPEVGDEVLVAFDQGQAELPYILGGLWSQAQLPPETNQNDENNQRLFKSRSGLLVQLDDTKGSERITVQDKNGKNKIVIDAAGNEITITSEGDLTLQAQGNITLKSAKGDIALEGKNVTVKAKENYQLEVQQNCEISAKNNVEIKAQGNGALTANANLDLKANTNCTLKANVKATIEATAGLALTSPTGINLNNGALEVI